MRDIDPEILTAEEAAKLLRRSTRTLGQWRRTGEGPAWLRIGRTGVGYRRAAIDRWLRSQEHGGNRAA